MLSIGNDNRDGERLDSSLVIPQGGAGVSEGCYSPYCGYRGERESSGKSCDVNQVLTAEQIISKHMSA